MDYVILISLIAIFIMVILTYRKAGKTLANVDEVLASFAKFTEDVKAALAALQAKIDGGAAIESADLDKIKSAVDAADAALNPPAMSEGEEPPGPPPPGSGEGPGK